jgi:hypothetical protein
MWCGTIVSASTKTNIEPVDTDAPLFLLLPHEPSFTERIVTEEPKQSRAISVVESVLPSSTKIISICLFGQEA